MSQPTPWPTRLKNLWPHRRRAFGPPAGWLAIAAWLLTVFAASAQTVTVPAGNTGSSSARLPLASWFGYERTAMIYLSSEVSTAPVSVQSVAWYFTTKGTGTIGATPVKVYIKETSASSFAANTTVATEESGATLVYDATLPASAFTSNTWITLPLSTPYVYSGSQNLEIIVETNATGGGNGEGSGTKQFRYSTAANSTQSWATDTSPPTGTGTRTGNRPNLQVVLVPPPSCLAPSGLTASSATSTSATLSWTATGSGPFTLLYGPTGFDPATGGTTVTNITTTSYQLTGLTPNTTYQFYVTQNCGGSNGNSTRTGPASILTAPGYVVSRNTGVSYSSIQSTGTSFTGWSNGNSTDDNVSGSTAIGFSFQYLGQAVSNFRVSTNGWLSFNTVQVPSGTDNYANNLGNGSANTMLAPFWEDLVLQGNAGTAAGLAAAKMKYQLDGSAPNRVLTVEWAEMETFNNPGPNLNFQVKLYEGTNVIEYVYGNMSGFDGSNNYTYSYSLGLSGPNASTGQYLAQQVPNSSYFLNSGASTVDAGANALSIVPSCNSSIRFTPGTFVPGTAPTAAAPTNDEPAGATALTVGTVPPTDFCSVYSSANATATSSITACSATTPGTPDDDVWFSFTVPTVSNVTVTLRSSGGYDGVLQLFSGAPGSLTAVACANATGSGLTENYTNATLAAGTYYVRVYSAGTGSGTNGTFVLAAYATPAPPANDECATAATLTPSGTTCTPLSGTTIGATASSGAPTCTASTPGNADDDVWYKFTATAAAGTVTVQSGSGFDAVMQLYSGACASLTSIGCLNSTSTGGAEVGSLTGLSVGQTYYVRVYHAGSGTGSGSFSICLVLPTCTDPSNLAVGSITSTSASFSFTPGTGAVDYLVTATPQGGSATTITPAPTASPVALTGLTPSTQYTVSLRQNCSGGQQSAVLTTTFTTLAPPPANDECAAATPITNIGVGSCGTAVSGTNVGATASSTTGTPAPGCASYSGGDVWFSLTVPANGIVQVSTDQGSGTSISDTGLALYSGACGSLTLISCDDDSGVDAFSQVRATGLTPGSTIYARVWEYGNDAFGSFSICAQTDPACAPPTALAANSITSTSASISFTAPNGANSYTVRYTMQGDTTSTRVTPNPTASPVALTGLTPSTQYTVRIISNCTVSATPTAATITFTTLLPPPANDECAAATPITSIGVGSCGTAVSGTNVGATASSTTGTPAPGCASYSGGDVWFSLVVPSNGIVQVSTDQGGGSSISDTGLALYSGSCGSLTLISCDDDSGPGAFSQVRATGLTPGSTIYARVWEYGNDASGTFSICAQTDPACAPPTALAASSITSTSASLSFTAGAGNTSYTVTYTPQGGSATTVTPAPSASPVPLTGLTPSTQYSVSLVGNCSGGASTSAITTTFTTLAPPPANDECASATPITSIGVGSCGTAVSGTNVGATASSTTGTPAPGCASYSGGDVWFSLVVPSNGIVQVSTDQGSGTSISDTGLALYSGSCGSLTLISCDDDSGVDAFSLIRATGLTPGSTIYARVWEYGNDASGTFSICAQTDAPNLTVSSVQGVQGTYNNVTITSGGAARLTGPLTVNGTLTVQDGGILATNCQPVTGPGNFVLQAGGHLRICEAAGISTTGATGAIQLTGSRTFSNDAIYAYNGSTSGQVTGSGLPSRARALIVRNGNGLTLSGPLQLGQGILLNGGDLVTNGNALTLLSSASGTALVVNRNGIINGNVTVQRYIDPTLNPGMGYRHYSAPVTNTTLADLTTAAFTPVVNPTYNGSTTPNLVTPFPTVFGYDEARVLTSPATTYGPFDKGWVSPAATTDAMTPGRGYTVNIAASQTVDFVGTQGNGPVVRPLSRTGGANGGLHLVGNPYPAPIDWSQLTLPTGLDNAMYVYQSTSQYGGAYRSYVNGFGNPRIASGQGFFVRVSPGSSSALLTMTNAIRDTSFVTTPSFNRGVETRPVVQLTLSRPGATLADDAYVYFENGATAGVDARYDALKLQHNSGGTPSVYALTAGTELSINGLPELTARTVVPLGIDVPQAGSYSFEAAQVLNLSTAGVYLHDLQTGQYLDLRQQPRYGFTAAAAGAQNARFELVFEPQRPTASAPGLTAASVTLFPNPARGSFALLVPAVPGATQVQATLLNSLGQEVRHQTQALPASGTRLDVNVTGLATGVYTVRLQAGAAQVTKRVVIE